MSLEREGDRVSSIEDLAGRGNLIAHGSAPSLETKPKRV
jgi:hypothetical protein